MQIEKMRERGENSTGRGHTSDCDEVIDVQDCRAGSLHPPTPGLRAWPSSALR